MNSLGPGHHRTALYYLVKSLFVLVNPFREFQTLVRFLIAYNHLFAPPSVGVLL
jgi:hypothetical protein